MTVLSMLAVATVTLVPPAEGESEPAPNELERAIALLDALDTTVGSISAEDQPLAAVLEWVGQQVPLQVDWAALELIAVSRDDPVSLDLDRAPLATALASVCLQSGDAFERPIFEPYKGQIIVTTQEGVVPMRLTDVYDVRDLLTSDDAIEGVRATLPPIPPAKSGTDGETENQNEAGADDDRQPAGGGAGGAPPLPEVFVPRRDEAPRPRRLTPGEEFMSLIVEHVEPDAWLGFGGSRAVISEHDGVLMVSAVPGTHRRLRDALRRLRRAHLSQVTVEAAIIDVPRPALERLRRRHDISSAALGRSLLASEEGAILWRASTAAALDHQLSLDGQQDGIEVRIKLVPTFDRESGMLSIAVEAETKTPADARTLSTVVRIPFRDGGSVLEIPAAAAGEEVRLLVLIPSGR